MFARPSFNPKTWSLLASGMLLWHANVQARSNVFDLKTDFCAGCTACDGATSGSIGLPFRELPFVLIALVVAIMLLARRNRLRKAAWTLGIGLVLSLSICLAGQHDNRADTALPARADTTLSFVETGPGAAIDDSAADEFQSVDQSDEFVTTSDSSGFSAFAEAPAEAASTLSDNDARSLFRVGMALLAALIAGLVFRNRLARKFRYAFLLASLVYLGFYSSGCPCMISSFQNLMLLLLGEPTRWISLLWFIGLLPLTYFFGKVWCGWICHLGAVQEFLYRPGKLNLLQSRNAQRVLRILQYTTLAALLVQLMITRTNWFIKIDPFKVAFNLFSANQTGYVLLAVLLISSLLVYRPFCRGFCPVGLILGWVERIPGASNLQIEPTCKSCMKCKKQCDSRAIRIEKGALQIDREACIRCGDCLDSCRFGSIRPKSFLTSKPTTK